MRTLLIFVFVLSFFTVQVRRKIGLWNVVHEAFLKKNSAVGAVFELLNQLSRDSFNDLQLSSRAFGNIEISSFVKMSQKYIFM